MAPASQQMEHHSWQDVYPHQHRPREPSFRAASDSNWCRKICCIVYTGMNSSAFGNGFSNSSCWELPCRIYDSGSVDRRTGFPTSPLSGICLSWNVGPAHTKIMYRKENKTWRSIGEEKSKPQPTLSIVKDRHTRINQRWSSSGCHWIIQNIGEGRSSLNS